MANFTPSTDERESMIIIGIIIFYVLLAGFVIFLWALGRISQTAMLCSVGVISLVYMPRFLIIKKIQNKDVIRISESSIFVNNKEISFNEIEDYRVREGKPQVVFAMSNNLVVYKDAKFLLKLRSKAEPVEFYAIGTEKIKLLKEFFDSIL